MESIAETSESKAQNSAAETSESKGQSTASSNASSTASSVEETSESKAQSTASSNASSNASSVEETSESKAQEEDEEGAAFNLGDKVFIQGGILDGLRGRIYYLDEDTLKILPDGEFHRLVTIPIVEGDFDPELQIETVFLIQKSASPAFVAQNDFQVGYLIETITAEQKMGVTYTIKEINEEEDYAILVDETGADKQILFNFTGIPEDEEFEILRVREPPSSTDEPQGEVEGEETEQLEDIELPQAEEIREIPSTQRFYPDIIQRNDMFQEMVAALTIKQQKNPERKADIRKLVETMMILRNEVMQFSKSGTSSSRINTYYVTLMELLKSTYVPLARYVVDAKKVVYLDHSIESYLAERRGLPSTDPTTSLFEHIEVQYLQDTIQAANEFFKTQIAGTQGTVTNPDALPNWYLGWEGYSKRFHQSWVSDGDRKQAFMTDTDFFRTPIPDMEAQTVDGLPTIGKIDKETPVTIEDIGQVRFSMLRGLASRNTRLDPSGPLRTIEAAETASIESYLLFPLFYDPELGSIRSGKLAIDMGKALIPFLSMDEILYDQKGISDIPTAGSIISLNGASLGNLTIEDWLSGQPLQGKGLGDMIAILGSFGLATKELNTEQTNVLIKKIDTYRGLVRTTIREAAEKGATAVAELKLQNNPLLEPDTVTEIITKLMGEPMIQKKITEFQARFPSYRENDIAIFSSLFIYLYDFVFATLAQNPRPLQIEIRRAARQEFLKRLHESTKLLEKKSAVGEVPQPNPCPHVRSLDMIRKVKEQTTFWKLLSKFITQFGGEKKDNWLNCNVCSKHCLCNHEILQLQEFMRPREKDALHKEILLTFSGGQFHGGYMCKNCGQRIGSVEYDTSLEYDDNGAPMMGRAVLVDTAAMEDDAIDQMLSLQVGKVEEIKFGNETQTDIYKIAKQIYDRIGIQAKEEGYIRIVQRVEGEIMKQPTRQDYSKEQKRAKAAGKTLPDYDVVISRALVVTTAAFCLLEIQTNIPGYVPRYKLPGCKASFSGYPMGTDQDKGAIDYISCAVAGIVKNEAPWNMTGFLKEKSDDKRAASISKYIFFILGQALSNSSVQQEIAIKKEYLESTFGRSTNEGGLVEKIPAGFAPEQSKRAAGEVIVAEAASAIEKARAWILQAHEIARASSILQAQNPFTEITCCYHPIQIPNAFWNEKPALVLPASKNISGPHGSHLSVHYKPRKQDTFRAVPSAGNFYRLFLKVCCQGERKGLPHEPGYDNLCPHCEFRFPSGMEDDDGKIALDTQKIDYSEASFISLLDESHRRYGVEAVNLKSPPRGMELVTKLAAVDPVPFEGWRAALSEMVLNFQKLPEGTVSDIDLATIYGPLSNLSEQFVTELITRIGQENGRLLERVVSQDSPSSIVESIRTYFLIPLQRIITSFHTGSLIVQESYKLGEGTVEDIEKNLEAHVHYLGDLKKSYQGLVKAKVMHLRNQLMAILPLIQREVRMPLLPGGSIGLPYLLKAVFLGMFSEFVNPSIIPEGMDMHVIPGASDIQARGSMQILRICLGRYKVEGMMYSTDEIRSMIARRNEVEKTRLVNKFKGMSDEEKAVEKLNKKLGLGDWAVGGTDAIRIYNPEQYERERREREEMGIVGEENQAEGEGYDLDEHLNADDF